MRGAGRGCCFLPLAGGGKQSSGEFWGWRCPLVRVGTIWRALGVRGLSWVSRTSRASGALVSDGGAGEENLCSPPLLGARNPSGVFICSLVLIIGLEALEQLLGNCSSLVWAGLPPPHGCRSPAPLGAPGKAAVGLGGGAGKAALAARQDSSWLRGPSCPPWLPAGEEPRA